MTQSMSQFQYPYPPSMLDRFAQGLGYLGGLELASAATGTATLVVPAMDLLLVQCKITSLSASDTVAMQVGAGAAVDTGASYWDRNMASNGANTLGIVTFANVDHTSASKWSLGYNSTQATLSDTGGTQDRTIFITISNLAGTAKTASWLVSRGTGSAATVPFMFIGEGAYRNTTNSDAQITALLLTTLGGTATLGANSGFGVWGRNFT